MVLDRPLFTEFTSFYLILKFKVVLEIFTVASSETVNLVPQKFGKNL